jgi:hypothetical protein
MMDRGVVGSSFSIDYKRQSKPREEDDGHKKNTLVRTLACIFPRYKIQYKSLCSWHSPLQNSAHDSILLVDDSKRR